MKIATMHTGRSILAMLTAATLSLQPGCRSARAIPGQRLALTDMQLLDFSRQITSNLFENGMMVGVGNDERYLYIFFTPDIRHRQRPPSRAQLTLWLDQNGGRAKKLSLVHISGLAREKIPPGTAPEMNGKNPPEPAALGSAPALLKIVDIRRGKEFFISPDGSQGPSVRLEADWGDFAYQWRIPFLGAGDWPGLKGDPGRVIGIGLHWQIEALAGPRKNAGERPGRRGAVMEGGGPPPGRGMGLEKIPAKRSLWLKTTLLGK